MPVSAAQGLVLVSHVAQGLVLVPYEHLIYEHVSATEVYMENVYRRVLSIGGRVASGYAEY